jgi:peptidoglycan/LPS O-acetylase OafA/YrhL
MLGDSSYAIYILHAPLWLWWDRITRVQAGLHIDPMADFFIYASIVIGVSLFASNFYEKPVRQYIGSLSVGESNVSKAI